MGTCACFFLKSLADKEMLLCRKNFSNHLYSIEKRHHSAQLCADLFDEQCLFPVSDGLEHRPPGLVLQNPLACELPGLDLFEHFFHLGSSLRINDPFSTRQIAIFSRVANGVPHIGKSAPVDEIYDQLEFVHALKKSDFRLVACLHKCVEPCFYQFGYPPAKDGLLAEKVRFGFFLKGGFHDAGPCRTDPRPIRQSCLEGLTGC